jgi:hypothetical protein
MGCVPATAPEAPILAAPVTPPGPAAIDIGGRPFVVGSALLAYTNHGVAHTRSDFPGRAFHVLQSTVLVFERDVPCDSLPWLSFAPKDARTGERFITIMIQSRYPFRPGLDLEIDELGAQPTDDIASVSFSVGGSIKGTDPSGRVRVVSADASGGVLELDAEARQHRGSPTDGGIHGRIVFRACPEPPRPTPPAPQATSTWTPPPPAPPKPPSRDNPGY